jgi:hypothetical protein
VSIRRLRNCVLPALFLFLFLLSNPAAAFADSLDGAVRNLVRRVVPMVTSTRIACVSWENREAVSDARSLQLRALFLNELGLAKVTPIDGATNCALQVAISKTPTDIVFVAQLNSGERKRVFFSEAPRADSVAASSSASVQMERQLLVQQSAFILDALEIPGRNAVGGLLVVLTRDAISLYSSDGSLWIAATSQPLPRTKETPRSPRGELRWIADAPDTLQIVLPAKVCRMNLSTSGPLTCQGATDAWRHGPATVPDCDGGTWDLRTDSGDWSQPDRILLTNPALPRTQTPLASTSLPGPVISLAPGAAPNAYTATVSNLSTGNYEVYRVTVSCRN